MGYMSLFGESTSKSEAFITLNSLRRFLVGHDRSISTGVKRVLGEALSPSPLTSQDMAQSFHHQETERVSIELAEAIERCLGIMDLTKSDREALHAGLMALSKGEKAQNEQLNNQLVVLLKSTMNFVKNQPSRHPSGMMLA